MVENPDTLSKAGAQELALRIERFWHTKGHLDVKVWIELVDVGAMSAVP